MRNRRCALAALRQARTARSQIKMPHNALGVDSRPIEGGKRAQAAGRTQHRFSKPYLTACLAVPLRRPAASRSALGCSPQPRSRNRIGLRTRKWKLPPGRRSRQSWSAERIPSLQSRPERRLLLGKITVDRGHSVPRMGVAASTSLEGGRSDTTISSASCLLKQTSGLKELNRHFAQLCRNFVVESEGRHRSFCETSAAESGNSVARL